MKIQGCCICGKPSTRLIESKHYCSKCFDERFEIPPDPGHPYSMSDLDDSNIIRKSINSVGEGVIHRCLICNFPLGNTNTPYCANHMFMKEWRNDNG